MNDSNIIIRNLNAVGQNIAKFREQMGWTREDLVAKLQLLRCNITHQILADIEKQCCVVTDVQIAFFSEVFRIPIEGLFSPKSGSRNGTE
jgi:ribosome-binding protein aMBF1 (putative translation factor)